MSYEESAIRSTTSSTVTVLLRISHTITNGHYATVIEQLEVVQHVSRQIPNWPSVAMSKLERNIHTNWSGNVYHAVIICYPHREDLSDASNSRRGSSRSLSSSHHRSASLKAIPEHDVNDNGKSSYRCSQPSDML
jgi:hypothetical protein